MKKTVSVRTIAFSLSAVVAIAVLMIGCGNSNSSMNNLSSAQAQAVASAVSTGVSQSLEGAFGVASAERGVGVTRIEDGFPRTNTPSCTLSSSNGNFSCQISQSFSCSGGGTMAISGNVSGSVSDSGTGSIQEQIAADPTNCSVDGTTLSGDPNVAISGQFNISNWSPVWPVTGTETGGVSFGPNPSGTCQFNVTFSVNSNLTCTTSGTACGQPVSGSC
jgi:hypothetical protein